METILEEIRLWQHLEFWQIFLHYDTTIEITKAMIKIIGDKLQSIAYKKEEGCRIRTLTRWMQYGDKMYKHLFSSIRSGTLVSRLITKLHDADNTIVSSHQV
jgi:hypothetical protein